MQATSRHDRSCWLGRKASFQTNKPSCLSCKTQQLPTGLVKHPGTSDSILYMSNKEIFGGDMLNSYQTKLFVWSYVLKLWHCVKQFRKICIKSCVKQLRKINTESYHAYIASKLILPQIHVILICFVSHCISFIRKFKKLFFEWAASWENQQQIQHKPSCTSTEDG